MKKFNYGLLIALFGIFFVAGSAFFGHEIAYNFAERFFRSGIWGILGSVGAIAAGYFFKKNFIDKGNDSKGLPLLIVGFVSLVSGFWIPAVSLKADRSSNIPDVSIYYNNGKVINATDPTKTDFYFKQVHLSAPDSIYVVENGEEPGYNKTNSGVRNGDLPKSDKSRADEDWTRPATKEAEKLDGKY